MRLYDIENSIYHVVARREKELLLFETDYQVIDIENVNSVKMKDSSLQFEDGKNAYSFNFSKSTLFRKFTIPQNAFRLPIEIVEDPFSLLLDLFGEKKILLQLQIFYKKELIMSFYIYMELKKSKNLFLKRVA